MSRLFLFSIGGTGSRIVRSLVHLMAAGVELRAPDGKRHTPECEPLELVPILIDTDATNKDTLDTIILLDRYQALHRQRGTNTEGGFFANPVTKLCDLADKDSSGVSGTFRSDFQSTADVRFRDVIAFGEGEMDLPTRHLLQALYSPDNLSETLTGGFLGNPNIGAVVLAAFKDSPDFKLFARSFDQGDRIVVLNSIFGGTGAAGLPWLLKWLGSSQQTAGATNHIQGAAVGAVTVLPYFQVQDSDTSRINSSSFVTKTKAALSYYGRNIGKVHALYYLGDTMQALYPNHESGPEQANPANIIELLAATAVVDFAGRREKDLLENSGVYEFALYENTPQVHLDTLGRGLAQLIGGPMTQLHILWLLANKHLPAAGAQDWAKNHGLSRALFHSSNFRDGLGTYLSDFYGPWIRQLGTNASSDGTDDAGRKPGRKFVPFDLNVTVDDMRAMIAGRKPLQRRFWQKKLDSDQFDTAMNELKEPQPGTAGEVSRFLALAWHGTRVLSHTLLQTEGV